jgi:hypothetical protein
MVYNLPATNHRNKRDAQAAGDQRQTAGARIHAAAVPGNTISRVGDAQIV